MTTSFVRSFSKIKDPRVNRTKQHYILDIIALVIMAFMAGAVNFEEIEDFGKAHKDWLKQFLWLPNGIPSHDTIGRLFAHLNPKEFQTAFLDWLVSIKSMVPETVIPIDGKTLRGSHRVSRNLKPFHVVSAWSHANGLSLGQLKVDSKTNEIMAIPELLKQLVIEGAIITIDALGCQKEIVKAICDKKCDYVLSVKGNQKSLFEGIRDCFDNAETVDSIAESEVVSKHNRIEKRSVQVLDSCVLEGVVNLHEWKSLNSIVKLTYSSTTKSTGLKTTENRYYISSLRYQDAPRILSAIRSHWSIESMHWSMDVSYGEDSCRIRNETTALNFAWMRKMSLSMLKAETSFKRASIRRKQLKLWGTPDYFLTVFRAI